jgi:hypothetical protein
MGGGRKGAPNQLQRAANTNPRGRSKKNQVSGESLRAALSLTKPAIFRYSKTQFRRLFFSCNMEGRKEGHEIREE